MVDSWIAQADEQELDRGIALLTAHMKDSGLSENDRQKIDDKISDKPGEINIAVVRLGKLSNFTDFDVFEQAEGVSLRYVQNVAELGEPDMIFLPGSKNTIGDLLWMRENGLEAAVRQKAQAIPIFGICGGFQMLGEWISDPEGVETADGCVVSENRKAQGTPGDIRHENLQDQTSVRGMELLPVTTVLRSKKTRRMVQTAFGKMQGVFSELTGLRIEGYEIHMGETVKSSEKRAKEDAVQNAVQSMEQCGNIYGTYIHGIFDGKGIAPAILHALAIKKGVSMDTGQMLDYRAYKETQYDLLADTLRQHMDMQAIYDILREARL